MEMVEITEHSLCGPFKEGFAESERISATKQGVGLWMVFSPTLAIRVSCCIADKISWASRREARAPVSSGCIDTR